MRVQINCQQTDLHVDVKEGEITAICTKSGDDITELLSETMKDEDYNAMRKRVFEQLEIDNAERTAERQIDNYLSRRAA